MNIAVVGCGSWADYTHLPCIIKYGANILACADISEANARSLSEKYNIPAYFTDYNKMLSQVKPDAVICLVAESAIAEVASDILRAYPVMLEKPPGRSIRETQAILKAAQKSGRPHMVAFNRRFAPAYLQLKKTIAAARVKYINYRFHRIKRHESFFETTAIHAVDAVRFLAGDDFRRVEIKYQEMPELGEKVANYFIYFEFAGGIRATAEILVSTGELSEGCEVHADGAVYRAALPLADKSRHYISQGFYNEHEHFYGCLKRGEDPGNGADTALQSVAVCDALRNRQGLVEF